MDIVLSDVLLRLMKGNGLSVASLSRETSIPRTTIHDWVNGRKPSARNIHHLATLSNYFNIGLSELLFGQKEGSRNNQVLLSTSFKDGSSHYKITLEKITTKGKI